MHDDKYIICATLYAPILIFTGVNFILNMRDYQIYLISKNSRRHYHVTFLMCARSIDLRRPAAVLRFNEFALQPIPAAHAAVAGR